MPDESGHDIVAPHGSPLAAAVLATADLEQSLSFYCDRIGFDPGPILEWRDPVLEVLAGAPAGAHANTCLLSSSVDPVGRILLLQLIDANGRPLPGARIQEHADSRAVGLANLNFYAADLATTTAAFRAHGFQFWTDPTVHDMSSAVGKPIEVLFSGPDGVVINFVELASADRATRIGQMRAYVEQHGRNRRGFTPVVTTSHVVRSMSAARTFYQRALGMRPLIDVELAAAESNAFLRLPPMRVRTSRSCKAITCSASSRCPNRATISSNVPTWRRVLTRPTTAIWRKYSRSTTLVPRTGPVARLRRQG